MLQQGIHFEIAIAPRCFGIPSGSALESDARLLRCLAYRRGVTDPDIPPTILSNRDGAATATVSIRRVRRGVLASRHGHLAYLADRGQAVIACFPKSLTPLQESAFRGVPKRHDPDQCCRSTAADGGAWHLPQDGPTLKLPGSPPSLSAWLRSSLSCIPFGEHQTRGSLIRNDAPP